MTRSKLSATSGRSAAKSSNRSRKPGSKASAKAPVPAKPRQERKPATRVAAPKKSTPVKPAAKPRRAAASAASAIKTVAKPTAKAAPKKPLKPAIERTPPSPEATPVADASFQSAEIPAEPRTSGGFSEAPQPALSVPLDWGMSSIFVSETVTLGSPEDWPAPPVDAEVPEPEPIAEPELLSPLEFASRDRAQGQLGGEATAGALAQDAQPSREPPESVLEPAAEHEAPEDVFEPAVASEPPAEPSPEAAMESPASALPAEGGPDIPESALGELPFRPPEVTEGHSEEKSATFREGDHVVYPTHGVGKVERIAIEEIAGHRLELIHITFEENRMTLRVPVAKARSAGLRKLASRSLFDEALGVLKGRARIKRTMWSRRAQEYEAKINSGDPLAIAEVVRDLHRNAGQPDQSFSERQIYEAAMDRLAAEMAALENTDKPTAAAKLEEFLKTPDPAKAPQPVPVVSD